VAPFLKLPLASFSGFGSTLLRLQQMRYYTKCHSKCLEVVDTFWTGQEMPR